MDGVNATGSAPRVVVVTGANSGIGLATAQRLLRGGDQVVMACRSLDRANAAADRLRADGETVPFDDALVVSRLDLSDPESIRAFADEWSGRRLDVLVNNAGVMALDRSTTPSGWETQFATNHLGHFALTGLLLPALRRSSAPRVVTVSSLGHRAGRLRLDDLMYENRRYDRWGAYFQSKLANVMFAREFDRRAKAADHPVRSVGCHPGTASTEIGKTGTSVANTIIRTFFPVVARSADRGAAAVHHACTASITGGEFFGPRWLAFGSTRVETPSRRARDGDAARRLWEMSEELTGVEYRW